MARGTGEIVNYRPVSRRHDDVISVSPGPFFLHAGPVDERQSRAANKVCDQQLECWRV
jgi:hypothetical protein